MMGSQQCSSLLIVTLGAWFVTGLSAERLERRQEGDKVVIPCSIDQTNQDGMYLYKNYQQRHEVTYLTSKMQSSPRVAFANRIQVTGVFTQPTVTITNLTIDDTGVYWCQYLRYEGPKQHPTLSKDGLTLLVVSGLEVCPTPAPTRHMMQPQDEQMSTMLVVTGITVFSLALIVFIILIIGVKHCFASKGKYSPGPQSGGDPDYEQMSPRTTSMSQVRAQRDTSASLQSSGLVLINPDYAAYPNSHTKAANNLPSNIANI